jgi:hypothetical protein|tara:strand:- start:56 stop:313 length:258 start_codon:yes stop_codon:yes gene_type:complete
MKRNKVVYVVMGSEDGILGVYGNKKGAYKEALRYINQIEQERKLISYAKVCRELKDVYDYSIDIADDDIYGNAGIHAVLFNEERY